MSQDVQSLVEVTHHVWKKMFCEDLIDRLELEVDLPSSIKFTSAPSPGSKKSSVAPIPAMQAVTSLHLTGLHVCVAALLLLRR